MQDSNKSSKKHLDITLKQTDNPRVILQASDLALAYIGFPTGFRSDFLYGQPQ